MKNLYKKDCLFILWEKSDDCDFFPITITHKKNGGNFYGSWMDFKPELDEMEISEMEDEWYSEKFLNREDLMEELKTREFEVILGEDY
jgi:hypothetical protein